MNPTLLGVLLFAAPYAIDAVRSHKGKPHNLRRKSEHRAARRSKKHARRRNR